MQLNVQEAVERMGDREIYLEIAHFFAGHLMQSIKELQNAFAANNAPEAARLIHSMKSNCATVGADALREDCAAIEQLCRAGDLIAAGPLFTLLAPKLEELRSALSAME